MKTCPEGHEYVPGNGCPVCQNERKRKRYAESAEFREKVRWYNRKQDLEQKSASDYRWYSENREQLNARRQARRKERYHTDPEYRSHIIQQNSEYKKRKKAREANEQ